MSKKLILKCPVCKKVLYELEEREPFVSAGKCRYCGSLTTYNPDKKCFEQSKEQPNGMD